MLRHFTVRRCLNVEDNNEYVDCSNNTTGVEDVDSDGDDDDANNEGDDDDDDDSDDDRRLNWLAVGMDTAAARTHPL